MKIRYSSPTVQYSGAQVAKAHAQFRELTDQHDGNSFKNFWHWLGTTELRALDFHLLDTRPRQFHAHFNIPDHAAPKMDLLLSPHYKTLYKAWKAKYG